MDLPIYLAIGLFVLGIAIGSFINVVAYRFPRGQSFIRPPSACVECKKNLRAVDLIPLISFIFLKGKCRYCGARISLRYFFVELFSGFIMVAVPLYMGLTIQAFSYLFLLLLLLSISIIDIDYKRIPNIFLVFGIIVGIVMKIIDTGFLNRESWSDSGMGMLAGGGIMLIIYIFGRGGIGAGDLKLMIMVGFFLGLYGAFITLLFGFILGGVYGLLMIILRKLNRKDMIPFGPFLSLGAFIYVFWGAQIIEWYKNIFLS